MVAIFIGLNGSRTENRIFGRSVLERSDSPEFFFSFFFSLFFFFYSFIASSSTSFGIFLPLPSSPPSFLSYRTMPNLSSAFIHSRIGERMQTNFRFRSKTKMYESFNIICILEEGCADNDSYGLQRNSIERFYLY